MDIFGEAKEKAKNKGDSCCIVEVGLERGTYMLTGRDMFGLFSSHRLICERGHYVRTYRSTRYPVLKDTNDCRRD